MEKLSPYHFFVENGLKRKATKVAFLLSSLLVKITSMPRGNYQKSEEHKAKIAASLRKDVKDPPPLLRNCARCDSEFRTYKSVDRKHCSIECYWRNMRGSVQTIETRKKRSDSMRGSKHWNWMGGKSGENARIRRSFEYRAWRTAIYKRDGYRCVLCGVIGGKLNADHIKPFSDYPELRFELSNGRTLCIPCHLKHGANWGKNNAGRKQKSKLFSCPSTSGGQDMEKGHENL